MNIANIALKARDLVNADSSTYTDASLLNDINIWYQKASTMILEAQDDADFDDLNATDYPIYSTNLVVGQRDYPIPETLNFLSVKRVDITYDGTNYYRAMAFDNSSENRGMGPITGDENMELIVDNRYSKTAPYYDIKYGSIFIYPRPSQAGGKINAEFSRQVVEFTSADLAGGTKEPGFDGPFHPILAYGPAFEFAQKYNMPQQKTILMELQDYEERLKRHYGNKDKDIRYVFRPFDLPEDITMR